MTSENLSSTQPSSWRRPLHACQCSRSIEGMCAFSRARRTPYNDAMSTRLGKKGDSCKTKGIWNGADALHDHAVCIPLTPWSVQRPDHVPCPSPPPVAHHEHPHLRPPALHEQRHAHWVVQWHELHNDLQGTNSDGQHYEKQASIIWRDSGVVICRQMHVTRLQ